MADHDLDSSNLARRCADESGTPVIMPAPEPELSLDELLTLVTEKNLHGEFDTGPALGTEAW